RGYSLKHCTPVKNKVLCKNRNLQTIPEDFHPIVRSLDIFCNNISVIKGFKGLKFLKFGTMSSNTELSTILPLQQLDLSYNKLITISDHIFQGLANLSVLHLENNLIITIDSLSLQSLSSLLVVNLGSNKIHNLKDVQPLLRLTKLQELYISRNKCTSFESTSKRLMVLDVSWNPLERFSITADVLPNLKNLDLSYCVQNGIMEWDVADRSFLSHMSEVFIDNMVRNNELTAINESVMRSLPSLSYMDLNNNLFNCDCSHAWFIQWDPKLLDLDTHSCSVYIGFFYFISTTSLVLLTLLGSSLYHLLTWQVVYAYHLFLAYLYDTKQRNRHTANQYDALVSYNTHNEPWVMRELQPELEA
ncbi:unnamed protein product, partial [Coregonus sp. 'balchen']